MPPVSPLSRRAPPQYTANGGGSSCGPARPSNRRPLRVGYVSPDLFTHSVSYFAEAPLALHDADAVAVTVYDATPRRDAKSQRLRAQTEAAGGEWRCVESLSDEALAQLVRDDGIDVLVELTGERRRVG
jgi:protein O-GlcNAc transferase